MIDLGSADFYFRVQSIPREEFEAYSRRLFDVWDAHVGESLSLDDYALSLEVEEGSIKGKGKILAAATALYFGIAEYGSFIQGIQIIKSQVSSAGEYLTEKAQSFLGDDQPAPTVKRRSGALGQLQRLFLKVQHNQITVEEAMEQAAAIVGDEVDGAPKFMPDLHEALKNIPRHPEQTFLPLDGFDEELVVPVRSSDDTPRLPKPRSPLPPTNQLRIEIWRESKRGKKKVKVVEL